MSKDTLLIVLNTRYYITILAFIFARKLNDLAILNLKRLTEANLTGEWELKLKEMEEEKEVEEKDKGDEDEEYEVEDILDSRTAFSRHASMCSPTRSISLLGWLCGGHGPVFSASDGL